MTHFLQDILRQPEELEQVIQLLSGELSTSLQRAAEIVSRARHVYLTGIGASWNAALGAGALFHREGRPVYLLDASELLYSTRIPEESVVIILSRSGRSAEILQLLEKAQSAAARVVGITNFAEGGLGQRADIAIVLPVHPDHGFLRTPMYRLRLARPHLLLQLAEHSTPLSSWICYAPLKRRKRRYRSGKTSWQTVPGFCLAPHITSWPEAPT